MRQFNIIIRNREGQLVSSELKDFLQEDMAVEYAKINMPEGGSYSVQATGLDGEKVLLNEC